MTDETIKGDCYVSLIRDNEDGSSDFQFNFPPEALAALTRLGILTAIQAGIGEAECLNPDTNLEQEPVGWHTEDHLTDRSATTYSKDMAYRWECKGWPVTPLYTSPPAKQWVVLTADEYHTIRNSTWEVSEAIRFTEAKLKEKNYEENSSRHRDNARP